MWILDYVSINLGGFKTKATATPPEKLVGAGVREKCRDSVPETPGFVFITAIMFIFL